jgi:hypothetical protein
MSTNKFPDKDAFLSSPVFLSGPVAKHRSNLDTVANGLLLYLSGSLDGTNYSSVLSISGGPGVLHRALAYANDATSRSIGLKIILDGITIVTTDSDPITALGDGVIGIGTYYGSQPIPFESSCDLQLYSNISETDTLTLAVLYTTT